MRLDGGAKTFRQRWGYELANQPPVLLEEDEDEDDVTDSVSLRCETPAARSAALCAPSPMGEYVLQLSQALPSFSRLKAFVSRAVFRFLRETFLTNSSIRLFSTNNSRRARTCETTWSHLSGYRLKCKHDESVIVLQGPTR